MVVVIHGSDFKNEMMAGTDQSAILEKKIRQIKVSFERLGRNKTKEPHNQKKKKGTLFSNLRRNDHLHTKVSQTYYIYTG